MMRRMYNISPSATFALLLIVMIAMILSGCQSDGPQPDSDSGFSFQVVDGGIPVDDAIYNLVGVVVADIKSLQTTQARGSLSAIGGYASGSYVQWMEGKGFLRVDLTSVYPLPPFLETGKETVVLKTTDSKAIGLLPGDQVKLKCRVQYENVAATKAYEVIDVDSYGTWEFDYCRLVDPIIGK